MNEFLPENVMKFCPFCGAKDFHPGDRFLECGQCKKKFYINAAAAVACIIVDRNGDVLLTRRRFDPAKGMLDLPGGFVDLNETAEYAVKREIREELNLEVEQIRFMCSFPNQYLYGGVVYHTLDLGFICTVSDFSAIATDDDVDAYVFAPIQEIDLQKIGFPSIRKLVQAYIDKQAEM